MVNKGLRFGIICNDLNLEHWVINCINRMLDLEFVDLALIALVKDKKSNSPLSKPSIVKGNSDFISLGEISLIECERTDLESSDICLSNKDTEIIRSYQLDFLLNLTKDNISGENLELMYGVWAFHYSNFPNYIKEINRKENVTCATLYRLSKQNKQLVLKQGHFSIIKNSYKKNKNHIRSVIAEWPALVCRDILNRNTDYFYQATDSVPWDISEKISPSQTVKFIVNLLNNKYRMQVSKLFSYEYWNIGIVPKPIHEFLNDTEANIDWFVQKDDLYYADPFAYEDENGVHLLMEELDYKVVKGYISGMDIQEKKDWSMENVDQAMMKLPCHMSYPFILEYNNEVYCIPETSEAKEAVLYRLERSTKVWVKVKTLLEDFHAVDSTIFPYGDYWWLFCTRSFSSAQSHNNELHIFYATDLLGEWKPHRLNPVKIDIRSARPAGTPFSYKGELFRPAQDCSKTYGGRIVMNKIKTLSISQFEEEPVSFVNPNGNSLYPDGVHTISSVGGVTILDGKRFDYRFLNLFKKLYRYKLVMDNAIVHLFGKRKKPVYSEVEKRG